MLLELHDQGKSLEYVISTHYDKDHISGLIEFIKQNGKYGNEQIIPIENVIMNGYGSFSSQNVQLLIPESERPYLDGSYEISSTQQIELDQLCENNQYPINVCAGGSFITNGIIVKGADYTIHFLSPTKDSLEKFKQQLLKEKPLPVQSNSNIIETREIAGFFYSDIADWKNLPEGSSLNIINKASISFEIEYNGKHMLFCSDSDMNDIRKNLKQHYDVIKLSHHGTYYGNQYFIGKNAITADKYIISTNAKRDNREHPNRLLLHGILTLPHKKRLYCNYIISDVKNGIYGLLENNEQQERYDFEYFANWLKFEV